MTKRSAPLAVKDAHYVRLKGDVADITPELKAASPHIAFFEKVNPTWRRGTDAMRWAIAAADHRAKRNAAALQARQRVEENIHALFVRKPPHRADHRQDGDHHEGELPVHPENVEDR